MGIGGIAMGNLAFMLKQAGFEVSGSDQNLYPPMSTKLEEWGLTPKSGYKKENVHGADLVIIGNAISRGNPEVEEVLSLGLDYMSMAEAIGHFFLKRKKSIVISGTHGKTTTTFLTHWILDQLGFSPGLFVGGIRKDGHVGFQLGQGDFFVIEGDEYDSAFFDKSSKFLHYRPHYLAINALDFDHADIFPNLEAIQTMFKRLLNLVPKNGKVFYWKGAKNLFPICKNFSHAPIEPFDINGKGSILSYKKGKLFDSSSGTVLSPKFIGAHNYRNAEVAVRICLEIAPHRKSDILKALESFPGVKRRQEILFSDNSGILVEDFAHHPVAIAETILAFKEAYPGFQIISLFEPRSATSHRNVFQKDFAKAFAGSSQVIITEVFNKNKVKSSERLNVKKLLSDITKREKIKTVYAKTPEDIPTKVEKILKELNNQKVILLAMSNGAFGGIYPRLTEMMKNRVTK